MDDFGSFLTNFMVQPSPIPLLLSNRSWMGFLPPHKFWPAQTPSLQCAGAGTSKFWLSGGSISCDYVLIEPILYQVNTPYGYFKMCKYGSDMLSNFLYQSGLRGRLRGGLKDLSPPSVHPSGHLAQAVHFASIATNIDTSHNTAM